MKIVEKSVYVEDESTLDQRFEAAIQTAVWGMCQEPSANLAYLGEVDQQQLFEEVPECSHILWDFEQKSFIVIWRGLWKFSELPEEIRNGISNKDDLGNEETQEAIKDYCSKFDSKDEILEGIARVMASVWNDQWHEVVSKVGLSILIVDAMDASDELGGAAVLVRTFGHIVDEDQIDPVLQDTLNTYFMGRKVEGMVKSILKGGE